MEKKKQRGFTLIELLVVIAIIGILSSIVVINVNSTRNKAKDKSIMTDMINVRNEAEILNNDASSYTGVCQSATTLGTNGNLPGLQGGITNTGGSLTCYSSISKYCVQTTLPGGGSFCVDYTNNADSTNVSCDNTNYNCANP